MNKKVLNGVFLWPKCIRFVSRAIPLALIFLATSVLADDLDLRIASSADYYAVFNQLADGLDYTEDGEIVAAPGRRLPLNDATRVAIAHFVARYNPQVTFTSTRLCQNCGGKGSGVRIDGREGANVGFAVSWVCGPCSGKGSFAETRTCRVVFSGALPKKPDSPKVIAFRRKLVSARDGNASAQLEVATAYMDGKVVAKSLDEARDWFTKAAIQGERSALAPLARLYLDETNSFHDRAFGLALSALAFPETVQGQGKDFVRFKDVKNDASSPEAGLARHLQVLEAGLLAPLIAQGLQDKTQAEKLLMPDTVRRSFPPKPPLASGAILDVQSAYATGLARYFGHGFAEADREAGLRLVESAASRRDIDSLLLLGMHFDAGIVYPLSAPTAWAYYKLAARAGRMEPFSGKRLSYFSQTEIPSDWEAALDVLFVHFQAGAIPAGMFRELADLSLYRTISTVSARSARGGPFDTSATQGNPLSKSQVYSRARSLMMEKMTVIELAGEELTVTRKCWDDGTMRFYSVSGVVSFMNADSRGETVPYTLCFKVGDAASSAIFLSVSAGSVQIGEFPAQCVGSP